MAPDDSVGWGGVGGSAREGARCGRRRIAASNLISLLDVEIDGAAVRNLQPLRGRRKNQTREGDGGCWRNLIGSVSQSVGLHQSYGCVQRQRRRRCRIRLRLSWFGPSLGGEIAASPLPPPNPHPSFWVKCCLGNLRGKKAGECGGG